MGLPPFWASFSSDKHNPAKKRENSIGTGTIIPAYPLSQARLPNHFLHQKVTTLNFAFITIKYAFLS